MDRNSIISLTRQFHNKASVQFVIPNHSLFSYLETHSELEDVVTSLLRIYGGIFDHITKINTLKVAEKASVTEAYVLRVLHQLEKDQVIHLNLTNTDAKITFIEPREDDKTINRIAAVIAQQNQLKQYQVKAMLKYIDNDSVCKSKQLLSYFDETEVEPCGICTVCLRKNKINKDISPNTIKKSIIELLENGDQTSRHIISHINASEDQTLKILNTLLEHNIISITETNTYKLSHL